MKKNNDTNAIIVENVTKSFKVYYDKASTLKDRLLFWKRNQSELYTALKNIDVTIKKGETVGLVGVNGSGKSTLLKTLVGMVKPISGEYSFGSKVSIGYFSQNLETLDNAYLNAEGNLCCRSKYQIFGGQYTCTKTIEIDTTNNSIKEINFENYLQRGLGNQNK